MMSKSVATTATLLFILISGIFAQQHVQISGFVRDQISGELLIGANIVEHGTWNGAITDYNGHFSITMNTLSSLHISYVGYNSQTIKYSQTYDTVIHIFLVPGNELKEVVIQAQRMPKFNVSTLNHAELQYIPSMGGKPDVIKSLQLLPGINPQNEGSSLLLVRGGDPGQNLYLFDNVPVIYVNHFGGFTSVFNPDIINNIDIYKGAFPSRYGGRLSSVIDIVQKEGNKSGLKGSVGLGVSDASFTIEGPLKWRNTSFIITGRKTMIDAFMAILSKISEGNNYIVAYGFHDINGKFSWKPDDKNSFSLNFYQGDDYFNYWSKEETHDYNGKHRMTHAWGNWLVSARWNRIISSRLFVNNTLSYTRYRLKEKMKYSMFGATDTVNHEYKYLSSVQDISLRSGWKYKALKSWDIEFGAQTSLLLYMPGFTYQSDQPGQPSRDMVKSVESSLYIDNRLKLLRWFEPTAGVRIVNYSTQGYTGFSIEPRLNLNFTIDRNHTLNASYMKVTQYSHLIFSSGDILYNEVWIPSDKQVSPATSDQYTVGWNGLFVEQMFTLEIDLYYKNMLNLTTYKEGYTNLRGDNNWRSKVETDGRGEALGAELFIRKNIGKWTGFAGYSISNAKRQFPNINQGREYLFDFDRLYSASFSVNYKLSEKLFLNLTWVYQTGLPYTPAIGRQYIPFVYPDENGEFLYYEALIYGERNSERMKDYHRLDIGLTYSTFTKKRNHKAEWNFSIYNIYNRNNPYFYYYNTDNSVDFYRPEYNEGFKPLSLYQVSCFPIIPTLSYKVYFDRNSSANRQKSTFKQNFVKWLYHEN